MMTDLRVNPGIERDPIELSDDGGYPALENEGLVFQPPIAGGAGTFSQLTVAEAGWLRSGNYVSGEAGYQLTDTTVEFNEGEFRGTVTIDPEATGNLIEFKFDGDDIGEIVTELGTLNINGPGADTAITFGADEVLTIYAADELRLFGSIRLNGEPVTFGPNDSAGAGYRMVRVPNL